MKFSCIRLISIAVVSFLLVGCQTEVSKPLSPLSQSLENLEPISLATWLENSPIDLVDDLPVEAGEVGLKKLALRRLAVDIIHRAQ